MENGIAIRKMSFISGDTYTTDSGIPAQNSGTTVYYEIFAEDNEAASTTSSEQSYTIIENSALSLPYFQGFETELGGMTTENVSGAQVWENTSFGQPAPCAIMSGYDSGTDYANEDWLITPALNFNGSYSEPNLFRLVAKKGNYTDGIAIGFYEAATNDFENFDTEKRFAESIEYPQLYSLSNGMKLAVNSLANKDEVYTIPLGIKVNFAGTYTLSATNINEFNSKHYVYLLDKMTGKTIDLRKQDSYQVEFTTPGEYTSKLSLVFSDDAMYLNEQDNKDIKVFSNNNRIYIESQNISDGHFTLSDMKGNKVFSTELSIEKGIQEVQMNKNITSGIYFVHLHSEGNSISKKIWLKH